MNTRLGLSQLRKIKQHLKEGGVIAYPTESCYGLGCLPQHAQGLRRLIRLKKRPQHKGMIVIAADLKQFKPWLKPLSPQITTQLHHTWPAAITFLLPSSDHVLPQLRGKGRNKLAVRVPDHAQARHLCKQNRSALVSTSCNRAGQRPCRTSREVQRRFGKQVFIIKGLIGKYRSPSKIIDVISGQRLR